MKYIVNCPLTINGDEPTAEARALYMRLAGLLLERFNDVRCKFELRNELDPTQKPRPPLCLPVYKATYWGVFEFDFTGYSAYIDGALTDLAEDFGLDFVEWTQDGSKFRKSAVEAFVAAYDKAYPEAA